MNQKHTSQLLFIYPQDPLQSFLWSYEDNNSKLKEQTLGSLLEMIEKEKQCYMEVTDTFGRPLPEEFTEESFKPLQPFYITSFAPRQINLHFTLPTNKEKIVYTIDPDNNLDEVKKFVEQKTGIPTEKQKYFVKQKAGIPTEKQTFFMDEDEDEEIYFTGEKLLNDHVKLLRQIVCEEDVEMRLELKPTLTVRFRDEVFEVYPELRDYVTQLVDAICRKKKLQRTEFYLFHKNTLLNENLSLSFSGVQENDMLIFDKKILLESGNYKKYFPASFKISEVTKSLVQERKYFCGDSDGFTLSFGNILAEEDRLLSDFTSSSIQFEVKLKPGYFFVQFMRPRSSYLPNLAILPCNSSLHDLKRFFFQDWLLEADGYEFLTKDGKVVTEEQSLRELNPEGDIVELGYRGRWEGFQVFVKLLDGRTGTFNVSSCHRIEVLQLQIEERAGVSPDEQILRFAGHQLQDGKTIGSYKIEKESTIHLVLRLKGGHGAGMEFADITREDKAKTFKWSNDAPDWRITTSGLCLEGKCLNQECKAFGQWVVINKEMGTYDLIYDQYQNKCPMCLSYVKVEKCAFSNCRYAYTGIKLQEGGLPPQKVTLQQEIEVGDCYKLFDPKTTGSASWLTLKIVTKELNDQSVKKGIICGVCREAVKTKEVGGVKLGCAHLFHDECLQKVKNILPSCAYCHL